MSLYQQSNATRLEVDNYLHAVGLAFWQLARLAFLYQAPGAWHSPVPVLPFSKCLRRCEDRVEALLRFSRAENARVTSIDEIQEQVERIRTEGFDVAERCIEQSLQLALLATRILRKHTVEHAMALRFVARNQSFLPSARHYEIAISGLRRCEESAPTKAMRDVYASRRMSAEGEYSLQEGERYLHSSKNARMRSLRTAREKFDEALAACQNLRLQHPTKYAEHVENMALFQRWAAEVAMCDWSSAISSWTEMHERFPLFVQRRLPLLRDFPIFAGKFLSELSVPEEHVARVAYCLKAASNQHLKEDHKRAVANAMRRLALRLRTEEAALVLG